MSDVDSSGVLHHFRSFVDEEILQKLVTLPEFNGTVYQDQPAFLKEYVEIRFERMDILPEGAVFCAGAGQVAAGRRSGDRLAPVIYR